MKIYFSGSISGGRGDVALYQRIVAGLRERGFEVLDGEVTNGELVVGREPLGDRGIFERDLGWIAEVAAAGGALVAEVSTPSLGVGYEIAAARYRFAIPVVCLYREGRASRCSAMVAGDPGVELVRYEETGLDAAIHRVAELLAPTR